MLRAQQNAYKIEKKKIRNRKIKNNHFTDKKKAHGNPRTVGINST